MFLWYVRFCEVLSLLLVVQQKKGMGKVGGGGKMREREIQFAFVFGILEFHRIERKYAQLVKGPWALHLFEALQSWEIG